MAEINKPANLTYWIAHTGNNVRYGFTESDQVTSVGTANFETFSTVNALLDRIKDLPLAFLPNSGYVLQGSIYRHGITAYKVRVDHDRHPSINPANRPDMFISVTDDVNDHPDWQEDERVFRDEIRTHNSSDYRCLRSHTTQVGFEPDVKLTHWTGV